MKLLARILIILFVHKFLSVQGERVLENSTQTQENGLLSEASVREALYELHLPKNELHMVVKNENTAMKNMSELEGLLKTNNDRNFNPEEGLRIALENTQTEIENASDISDEFEMQMWATAIPMTSSELDAYPATLLEHDFKHVARQPKDDITVSDTFRQISAQHKVKISEQHVHFMAPQSDKEVTTALPVLAESEINKKEKPEISHFPSNLTKDEDKYLKIFNQSWTENRAKTINEYKIDRIPFNSSDVIQSCNLPESELIEIVLKEVSTLNKHPKESISNPEIAISNSNSLETKKPFEGEITFTKEWNENATNSSDPITYNKLASMLPNNFEVSQNYIADNNQEEWLVAIIAASSAGPDVSLKPLIFNATENLLDAAGGQGIKTINKTQAKTTSSHMTSSLIEQTDADKLTPRTSNSLKLHQTLDESGNGTAFEKVRNLTQTQKNALILTKPLKNVNTSVVAVNELSQRSLNGLSRQQNANETENKPEDAESNLNKHEEDSYYANKLTAKPLMEIEHFAETQTELEKVVVQDEHEFHTAQENLCTLETATVNPKTLYKAEAAHNSNVQYDELNAKDLKVVSVPVARKLNEELLNLNTPVEGLEEVTKLNEVTDLSSAESLAELATSTDSHMESTPDLLRKYQEPKNDRATHRYSASFENQQLLSEHRLNVPAPSSFSFEDEDQDSGSKPVISLEEYAIKQMNFILDHLLSETHKFVAKVLEATLNSVFPRDALKHYAEGANQLLNPIMESDYSEENLENTKTDSNDEIYEQIVEKLNFLKSKQNKYLQKQLPPEWLNEFRDKRAELAIWLDKASEQMQKELNAHITEEQDPIKHQYFNETFDDISRATEIHHKLAFLADLVKIIKNKKQITFMDLYMQT